MSTSCWDASPTICGEPQRFSSRHEVHCVCRSSITVLSQPETLNRRRCAPALTPKSSSRRLATPLRKGLTRGEGKRVCRSPGAEITGILLVLGHAPEHRRGRGDPAADLVLAVGERLVPLP